MSKEKPSRMWRYQCVVCGTFKQIIVSDKETKTLSHLRDICTKCDGPTTHKRRA